MLFSKYGGRDKEFRFGSAELEAWIRYPGGDVK